MNMESRTDMTAFGHQLLTPAEVLTDAQLAAVIQAVFVSVLSACGVPEERAKCLFEKSRSLAGYAEATELEEAIRDLLLPLIDMQALRESLDARAALITEQIAPYVSGGSILDIGCGDGLVSLGLAKSVGAVQLVDICNYRDSRVSLPFLLVSESDPLPFQESQFETSMLLTVLHHANDPLGLLRDAIRVTERRLIIIESVFGFGTSRSSKRSPFGTLTCEQQRKYAVVVDWIYNRLLHYNVPVPYNFFVPVGWKQLLTLAGLSVVAMVDLGVDQPLVPEYHVLYIADKTG